MSAPNLTIGVEPSESGKVVYLPLAAKTANDKPNGQLALKLSVKNNENKTVRLKNLKISFIGSPPVGEVTLPIQVKDKDDDQMKDLEIEAGKTAKWFFSHENHIILPAPAPGTIKLSLFCDVFDTPATVTMPLGSHKSPTPAGSYSFPAQVGDLRLGEYWSGRSTAHKPAGDGSQLFGYDMGVMAWDTAKNDWNGLLPGKEGDKNEHYRIWGKPICAMADGTVVDFKNDMPNNTKMGKQVPTPSPVEGNHFYIQHGDELVVYAHLQPSSLNSKFMKKGASVKRGDFFGLAGNSGNSTNPHLHIHVIQATQPWGGPLRPLPFHDVHVIDRTVIKPPDPAGPWVKADDQGLPNVPTAIWPAATKPAWYPPGWPEIARHGVSESSYQTEFEHIVSSGYRPVWTDGYDVNGKTFFNAIFRPVDGTAWAARHGLTSDQYQAEFETQKQAGLRPLHVESYLSGGSIRYATIFVKSPGPAWNAYHGKNAAEHKKLFDELTADGWRPVNISVVSVGGERRHTALYEKENVGSFFTQNFLTADEYQTAFNDNDKAGRKLVYLNAYTHLGAPRFTAIWHSKAHAPAARHGMSSSEYQTEWDKQTGNGLLTQAVTGYESGDKAVFAAFWSK